MGGSVDLLEGISREVAGDKFKGKLWGTARYIHNYPATPENKNLSRPLERDGEDSPTIPQSQVIHRFMPSGRSGKV